MHVNGGGNGTLVLLSQTKKRKPILKMKASMSLTFKVFSLLILSLSLSAPSNIINLNLDNFLQCLRTTHLHSSYPISEAIYTPNNSSFESVLQAYVRQRRFLVPTTPRPVAIVTALHESHVQATVICAKSSGMQMRTRSGGHDYDGLSYVSNVPFVILDMFNLRSIHIDIASETAWVQSGATLGEIYYKIATRSDVHAFPAGVGPTVGAGGHFSGGGYGVMMRKYGLSVDNIIDAQMVNVNGKILHRKSMGEDLFWAIRGGGGASFGVVLSWKIKLVRVPNKVTVFKVDRTLEQGATDIIYQWQQVAHKLAKELFIRAMPQVVNPSKEGPRKTVIVSFYGLFLGQSNALLPMMNKRFPKLGLQQKDCHEIRWIESIVFWADFPNGTSIDVLLNRSGGELTRRFFKFRSDYVKNIISKEALEKIWRMMMKIEGMWMQWNPYGGIMSEISEGATPFPHRAGYLFNIQYATFWNEEEDTSHYMSLSREMYDAMTPYVTMNPREAFLNYRDLEIGNNPSNKTYFERAVVYGTKYFKGNFFRLVKIKGKVDLDNFFKNEQSIPVEGNYTKDNKGISILNM